MQQDFLFEVQLSQRPVARDTPERSLSELANAIRTDACSIALVLEELERQCPILVEWFVFQCVNSRWPIENSAIYEPLNANEYPVERLERITDGWIERCAGHHGGFTRHRSWRYRPGSVSVGTWIPAYYLPTNDKLCVCLIDATLRSDLPPKALVQGQWKFQIQRHARFQFSARYKDYLLALIDIWEACGDRTLFLYQEAILPKTYPFPKLAPTPRRRSKMKTWSVTLPPPEEVFEELEVV